MLRTDQLVADIRNNKVEKIEVGGMTARITKTLPEIKEIGNVGTVVYLGDNTVALISDGYGTYNFAILNLSTNDIKKGIFTLPSSNQQSVHIKSAIVLDDPNKRFLALGDLYGRLYIVNLEDPKKIIQHQIGKWHGSIAHNNHHSLTLHKHKGFVYGITDSYMHRSVFVAPSVSTMKPEVFHNLDQDIRFGDIAMDGREDIFFSYGKHIKLRSLKSNNHEIEKLDNSGQCLGTRIKLVQSKSKSNNYLIYSNIKSDGIVVYEGTYDSGINYMHLPTTFPFPGDKEKLYDINILSENEQLILIRTDKNQYIYDLPKKRVLGKLNNTIMNGFYPDVENGQLVAQDSPNKLYHLTVFQLTGVNALNQILDALKSNTTVEELTISQVEFDENSLQAILFLKENRSDLKITLPDNIDKTVMFIKQQSEYKTLNSQLQIANRTQVERIQQIQAAHTAVTNNLNSDLTGLRQRNQELTSQLVEQKALTQSEREMNLNRLSELTLDYNQRLTVLDAKIVQLEEKNLTIAGQLIVQDQPDVTDAVSNETQIMLTPIISPTRQRSNSFAAISMALGNAISHETKEINGDIYDRENDLPELISPKSSHLPDSISIIGGPGGPTEEQENPQPELNSEELVGGPGGPSYSLRSCTIS